MPRMRSAPKMAPAMVRATIARRSIFMVGERTKRGTSSSQRRVAGSIRPGRIPRPHGYRARMELRIVRHTPHFDDTCRFYGEVLGWPITRQWPASDGSGRGCIFGYGDVGRLEFLEADHSEPVTGVFLSMEEPDVAGLLARLTAAGVPVLRGLADQPWGHRNFAVLDPSGLELVFFQWIDAAH